MLRWLGRFIVGAAAAAGAIAASQFPEFAQQYRQRLGGALHEVQDIVADFDATAAGSKMSRDQAVQHLLAANEAFLRDQGAHVQRTLHRLDRLSEQRARLESAPALARPVIALSQPDPSVLRGTWGDFEPAVPTTPSGFVWAAIGFFLAGGVVSLVRQMAGIGWRYRRRRMGPVQRELSGEARRADGAYRLR